MESMLPIMNLHDSETGCCPRFHPEDWDQKVFHLENELFVKVRTKSLFFIPINMGKVMLRTQQEISSQQADDPERYLMLSKDVSPFQTEHYLKVIKPVQGMETVKIPGTFCTKVFDGKYSELPKFMKSFDHELVQKKETILNRFAFYTTCPKCAKQYGHNYIVLFYEIEK